MKKTKTVTSIPLRGLNVDEVRLISDLRVMHAKVNELSEVVKNLRRRHGPDEIHHYADRKALTDDIDQIDEIYLWFVKLKHERE